MEAISFWSLCKVAALSRLDRVLELKQHIPETNGEPAQGVVETRHPEALPQKRPEAPEEKSALEIVGAQLSPDVEAL